jgi:hypothetical protein
MSALLKSERSVKKWLLGEAAYLVTGDGTFVITDKGLNISVRGGAGYFLPVTCGQDEVEVSSPGVTVYCQEATGLEYAMCADNWLVGIDIELRFPADPRVAGETNVLAAFEFAAQQLGAALLRNDLLERLSEQELEFTAIQQTEPWVQRSGFGTGAGQERLRTYNYETTIEVAMSDLGPESETPDPTEMWIAVNPVSRAVSGAGTEADPKLVSTAIEFDSLLETEGIRTFRLGPGVFLTRGAWAHPGNCILPTGGSVIGAGMDLTTIKLDPGALFTDLDGGVHPDTRVLIMGLLDQNNGGFECSDLTLDGNMSAFDASRVMAGLWVWGNACIIRNVRVRHIRGDRARNLECFGIHLNNAAPVGSWGADDGGSLIQDCIVEDVPPTDTYISAFYAGYDRYERTILPTVVERCQAILTAGNQTCFSANCNTTFRDCTGSGSVYGFYNDTGTVEVLNIENCHISDVRVGLSVKSTNPKPGFWKNSIMVTGSDFSLVGSSSDIPIGIEFWDQVGTTAYSDVDIGDSTFLATGFPLVALSILCPVASNITFHNNIVSAGTTQNIDPATQAGAVVVSDNSYSGGGSVPGNFPPYVPP